MSKITTLISRGNFIESSHNIKCYLGSIKNQQILSTDNENDIFLNLRLIWKIINKNNFS